MTTNNIKKINGQGRSTTEPYKWYIVHIVNNDVTSSQRRSGYDNSNTMPGTCIIMPNCPCPNISLNISNGKGYNPPLR